MSVTPVLRAKEASMAGRKGLTKSVLGLATGVALLAALAFSASAASSQNQAPRETRAFHATKDCSGFTGLVGAYCTIRSSNVKAFKVGSKIFYVQPASKKDLDSDTLIYVKRGSVAAGHCFLGFATGVGLCTISDGTGTLAGFQLRVRVTPDSSLPKLWHWDGTYSFDRG
jgi:Na+/proline symporter